MLKKGKNNFKIKPKSSNKSKKVFFNLKNKKTIKDFLLKDIDFAIFNNKISLFRDSLYLKLDKNKTRGFRYFFYNIKYFLKKYVFLNVLKAKRSIVKLLNNKKTFKKNRVIKNKIKNNNSTNNLFSRVGYYLTPDNKGNWMPEFRSFVILSLAATFVMNILFFADNMTKDLSRIVYTTAYAQEQFVSGIEDIKSLNTDIAKNKFYLAINSFYNLNEELSFFTKTGFKIFGGFINLKANDVDEMISNLNNINESSIKLIEVLENNKKENFLFKVKKSNEFLTIVNKNINNINNKVSNINTSFLPKEYENKINQLKEKVQYINDNSSKILKTTELLRSVLGEDNKQRFLLVFQNSNEIRATGGFIGSYALVDLKNGEILKTDIPAGGTYDLAGGFYKNIESPMPLKLLTNKWEIQDANWFLSFSKSAQKISNFFESGFNGSTVDGVIAINSNALVDLLELTGDIQLDKYNTILTKDNIIDEIQGIIKNNRNKTNKPKEIIVDLFAVVSDKLFNLDNSDLMKSITLLNKIIEEKNILAYFKDLDNEQISEDINISGNIVNTNSEEDYLSINYSNVGASKTSQIIKRSVKYNTKILTTGEVYATLEITNSYPKELELLDRNIDYIRVYTPKNSILEYASGFSEDIIIKDSIYPYQEKDKDLDPINTYKIKDLNTNTITYNDENKTIFGNFLYLDPGETKTIILKYKLPFKLDYNKIKSRIKQNNFYSLYIQSQPGINKTAFDVNVKLVENNIYSDNFILNKDKKILLNK